MSPPTAVKICGLRRPEDAQEAERAGASYGGVIFAPGRRTVTPDKAARLFTGTGLLRVGVFVDPPLDDLLRAARRAELDVVQLHGDESPAFVARIRDSWGGKIWKALRPRGSGEFLSGVDLYGSCVDGLLLDGWSPAAHGGTGARFPWDEIASVRAEMPSGISFIIAGGLTPHNVAAAIRLLRPDLVDVSSGVESAPGIKDPHLVGRFISAAQSTRAAPEVPEIHE